MSDVLRAPWTDEQVAALNEFQRCGFLHPFTCGDCRDRLGTWHGNDPVDRRLVATREGWRCPTCDYQQDWCHASMADPEMVKRAREAWPFTMNSEAWVTDAQRERDTYRVGPDGSGA